jgi:DNA adenine methylase
MTAIRRPALRWYGGKWRIARWIIGHFPPHFCYVEPFCGGASVLLRKEPSPLEWINDKSTAVHNFFRVLRERESELIALLSLTPFSRTELQLAYEPCDDDLELARRFYVRCWQARAGDRAGVTGWRFERSPGRGNSCIKDWCNVDHLHHVALRLKQVGLECDDAFRIIPRFDAPETLYYVDPPYLGDTRSRRWDKAYRHELHTTEDHRRLAEVLRGLSGKVVLSGYPSRIYDECYFDWTCFGRRSKTDVSYGEERLWLNPAAARAVPQMSILEAAA